MGINFLLLLVLGLASAEECPVEFTEIHGHCYLFSQQLGENKQSQEQARLFCQMLSQDDYTVDLATLGHFAAAEADPLLAHIYENDLADGGLWLGAERSGESFMWVDGRHLSEKSHLFYYLEPNGNDCIAVRPDLTNNDMHRNYINDAICTHAYNFVCETF
ncbi:unnamed protein product [Meganyctiphanes norvegica]|uniref:C-type lectin domain-containing protein n=1 Tax=Meganyctiphanes norvegica TaxID=48144 RepID=A0AAV2PLH8_MEGNR